MPSFAESTTERKRSSLSRSAASACLRAVMSSKNAISYCGLPAAARPIVWVSSTRVVERDAAGKPQYEIAFFDDITARKQAEAALRESEERFRSVVDSANDGILVYDKQLNVIAGNLAAERILGLPLANIIGAAGFTSLLPCVHADGSPILPDERQQ